MGTGKKIHYAWIVLVCCCMIQAGTLGAISNCKGVFYDAICTDLQMTLGTFTLQGVFAGITSALMTPVALKMLKKYKMNRVLFGACVLYTGMQFAMSFLGNQIYLWYFIAILQAVGGAFLLFLPVPIIINRWFGKKKGFAMAVAASFSGISGMVLNPVYARITELYGWRCGYRFSGVLAFCMVGPLLLLFLCESPEEKGLRPYGESVIETEKKERKNDNRLLDCHGMYLFVCLIIIAICLSCGSCFQSHLTKYGITLGIPLSISAFLPSAAMMGSVILKPVLGVLVDKLGPYRTTLIAFVLNVFGFSTFLLSSVSVLCLYIGSWFCGISMAGNVVLFPLLAEETLRGYDFERYYAFLSMMISMTGVTCGAVFGFVFDYTGSYTPVFVILVIIAIINLSVFFLLRSKRTKNGYNYH